MDTPPTVDQQLDEIGKAAEHLIESVRAAKRVRAVEHWDSQEEWQKELDDTLAEVSSALYAVAAYLR